MGSLTLGCCPPLPPVWFPQLSLPTCILATLVQAAPNLALLLSHLLQLSVVPGQQQLVQIAWGMQEQAGERAELQQALLIVACLGVAQMLAAGMRKDGWR